MPAKDDIPPEAARQLDEGISALGLGLRAEPRSGLLAYLALLAKWNRVYNLTAITDPHDMVARHLLDSLALVPYVVGPRVADVGTGAGLPGIPLALALPDYQFWLIDSNRKKTRFVVQAVAQLGLANVSVVSSRVADYRPDHPFDTVIARAFAELARLVPAVAHLLSPSGQVLAMKGIYPAQELRGLPAGFAVERVVPLQVPAYPAERHVVVIAHSAPPVQDG